MAEAAGSEFWVRGGAFVEAVDDVDELGLLLPLSLDLLQPATDSRPNAAASAQTIRVRSRGVGIHCLSVEVH
jgi:hypothetical protein